MGPATKKQAMRSQAGFTLAELTGEGIESGVLESFNLAQEEAEMLILQARVAESSGFARLDRVTLEAVGKCRFAPAREDGVARAATAQVRFTWKLQK